MTFSVAGFSRGSDNAYGRRNKVGINRINVFKRSLSLCPLLCMTLIMFSCPLQAMVPLDDRDLGNVCGQAGVNFNLDVTLNIAIDTASWGDSDGIVTGYANPWPGSGSGGHMGANDILLSQVHIRSRMSDSYNGYDSATMWKPITIDVAQNDSVYNGATFIRFGLGALEISWDHMEMEVALGPSGDNLNQTLGDLYMGKLDLYLNPASYIDVYNGRNAGQTGVTMTWYSIVDHIDIECISWGDSDGLGGPGGFWLGDTTTAGWIGLKDIEVNGPTSVIGTFAIDIATSGSGVYSLMSGHQETIVHVSFPSAFTLHTEGPITAEVRLDNTRTLDSLYAGTLGDIFINDFTLQIQQGSFVDIWAH